MYGLYIDICVSYVYVLFTDDDILCIYVMCISML